MSRWIKSLLCLGLVGAVLLTPAAAAAKKKAPPPPTRGSVVAVDAKAGTVTLKTSPAAAPLKCVLNDFSTIEINDKTAKIGQIKTGLWIRSIRLDSSTPPVVEDLDLTTKRS